ncbi:MAG: hypothetical protein KAQ87_01705 [Candidatus Pacebacteria bacterium]|nr:hypothetical protein [Candidatus Paceibacterota bacterium]
MKIDGNRIGVLFFEGEDAEKRAQAVMDSTNLNPFNSAIIQRKGIVTIMGLADNK